VVKDHTFQSSITPIKARDHLSVMMKHGDASPWYHGVGPARVTLTKRRQSAQSIDFGTVLVFVKSLTAQFNTYLYFSHFWICSRTSMLAFLYLTPLVVLINHDCSYGRHRTRGEFYEKGM
jgi:hypothetical protein